jgi:XTP/dITP diphosphohydrolase
MSTLLLATNNQGKMVEIQVLLQGLALQLVTPAHLGLGLNVIEDGQTYAENAARKASAFAQVARLVTLADDSGLEVDVLCGAPGLYSARYSPKSGADDADRRAYLLAQLQELPRPWIARFRCVIALAAPAGELYFAEGICPGEVIPEERGENGFGYDPIFLLPELGKTMAELSMFQKNQLSHRARAIRAAIPLLRELFPRSGE